LYLPQAKQRLLTGFQEIQHTLAEIHTFFESDGEEVQREWVRFTAKIDKKVEAVLHHTVKRSLQELNRLLNGDSKTEVLPVYRWVASLQVGGCVCVQRATGSVAVV
jgi:dynein heavy chain